MDLPKKIITFGFTSISGGPVFEKRPAILAKGENLDDSHHVTEVVEIQEGGKCTITAKCTKQASIKEYYLVTLQVWYYLICFK